MKEHNCHCHHQYISTGENINITKEDHTDVFMIKGNLPRKSINCHIDYPFDPNILSENAVLEGKTQLYIQYNDIF
jgi:hypothetical protein